MDLLAAVQTAGSGSLAGTLRELTRAHGSGTLVTCTSDLAPADGSLLAGTGFSFGTHLAIRCGEGAGPATGDTGGSGRTVTIRFGEGADLGAAWAVATAQLRSMAAAGRGGAR